ncbi:MAG TPA: Mov34/MPN/PAD-1 family protein [Ktedonobacteraceae bacterium]|nr:Mov34/MPN/PAD-1 family protein [Ktedonobacteraceae bacterium]
MRKHAEVYVKLRSEAEYALHEDVCQRGHIEACGLLLGTIEERGSWQIERVHPMRNIYNSPVYFEFAPEDLLTAELDYPGQIVGVYHSHPTGLTTASSTDRANMQRVNSEQHIPWVWLIISGPFDAAFQQKRTIRSSVIAYHHYDKKGLRQIPILFEDRREANSDKETGETNHPDLPLQDSEPIG